MGNKSSKGFSRRRSSSFASTAASYQGYPQSPYPQQNQYYPTQPYYTPQHHFASPPTNNHSSPAPRTEKKLERKYSRIADNYHTLEQVKTLRTVSVVYTLIFLKKKDLFSFSSYGLGSVVRMFADVMLVFL